MKLSELQSHIKEFDYAPEQYEHYFLKLIEEVGELSESIRKGKSGQPTLDELKVQSQKSYMTSCIMFVL